VSTLAPERVFGATLVRTPGAGDTVKLSGTSCNAPLHLPPERVGSRHNAVPGTTRSQVRPRPPATDAVHRLNGGGPPRPAFAGPDGLRYSRSSPEKGMKQHGQQPR
jgi:hypothetical protein